MMQRLRTIACSIIALFCLCQSARAQGTVWAWGFNQNGQLGNGTYTTTSPYGIDTPGTISGLTGVTAIAGGYLYSLALKSDGTVWAWGWNPYGELGNGTYTDSNTPVQVSGFTGVTAIAGGFEHALALKSDGTVWAWGLQSLGELGNGTFGSPFGFTGSNTPVQVLGPGGAGYLTGVTAIAAVGFHSLALKNDGTVWAWGHNQYGELGNGTYTNNDTPVQVLGPGGVGFLTGVTALGGGQYHSLALKSDGTVWAWGQNTSGELGNGVFDSPAQIPPQDTPGQVLGPGGVGFLGGVTAITGGSLSSHSLALKNDGTVWAWGQNTSGELGNGTTNPSNTPLQVLGPGGVGYLTGVAAIARGRGDSLALKSDGTVWAWGRNFAGELGNGTFTDSNMPVQVLGPGGVGFLSGVTAIAGGGLHSLALLGATPQQAINSLIAQVISPGLGFRNGEKTSLIAKLNAALGYLQAGDTADAIAVLQAFINEVNALVNSDRLTTAAAAPLISAAEGIIAEL
ncbi:MAG: hypothetical protein DMG31_05865 [Acidobacteria bacterium]|nr:MAG: hypothetical protein DMG31_05865 [Acidobacteriota bacterium]